MDFLGGIPEDLVTICQERLPAIPWQEPALARLPGVAPLAPGIWPWEDEAYVPQMALRDHLMATRRKVVFAPGPDDFEGGACELFEIVLASLRDRPGWRIERGVAHRPDGVAVPLDRDHPLAIAGRLVQSDLCLLRPVDDGFVLEAAFLAFPAAWRLTEKLGRPLGAIHAPVAEYDTVLAARIDRMLTRLPPGRPLWRMNRLAWEHPFLFQPEKLAPLQGDPRSGCEGGPWLRAERQMLLRLPRTKALLFAIHTTVLPAARLSPEERRGMPEGLRQALGL